MDGDWPVRICWNCGHYEEDTPAYKALPELFENMVRKNPMRFMRKYLGLGLSDENLQGKASDDDLTEP